LAYNKDAEDYKNESEKLTSHEKEVFIREILSGENGILRSDDHEARMEFLNTLFTSVFGKDENLSTETLQYFKAVFDAMVHYMDPERAGEAMARFLTAHVEGENFNELVKLFFEAFGFIGIKIAQYLVSNTEMIPEDMKDVLEELTSRVEGPDKRIVFEAAERRYGAEMARKCIKRVGRKLGGGSLMIFYECDIEVEPGDIRTCALGVLRSDIIQALPEDLVVVHRVIETMQAKPEIFGYHTVGMDLMDNLMYQSVVETNLERTAYLQQKMARQLDELMQDQEFVEELKADDIEVEVAMPHIMDEDVTHDGTSIRPNQGPLLWMDVAEGETLDLYLKKMKDEGDAGAAKVKRIYNTIATLAVHQLLKYGTIHADLHVGNILIKEGPGGKIKITIIDVGLGADIEKDFLAAMQNLVRIAVGHAKLEGAESLAQAFGDVDAFKGALGLGKVQEGQGRKWIRLLLEEAQILADETWPAEKMQLAEDRFWQILSREGERFQTKIAEITNVARELEVNLPRQFYYVTRMIGVMDYIWKEADGLRMVGLLKKLTGTEEKELFSEDKKDVVVARARVVLEGEGCIVTKHEVDNVWETAKTEELSLDRIRVFWEGAEALLKEKGVDDPDRIKELMSALQRDDIIRSELDLKTAQRHVHAIMAASEKDRQGEQERIEATLGKIEPLDPDVIAETAEMYAFGMLPRVWTIDRIHPGTVLSDSGNRLWYVTDVLNAPPGKVEEIGVTPASEIFIHYNIDECARGGFLGPADSGDKNLGNEGLIFDIFGEGLPVGGPAGVPTEEVPVGSSYAVLTLQVGLADHAGIVRAGSSLAQGEVPVPRTLAAELWRLGDEAMKEKAYGRTPEDLLEPPEEESGLLLGTEERERRRQDALAILTRFLQNNTTDLVSRAETQKLDGTRPIGKVMQECPGWEEQLVLLDTDQCKAFGDLIVATGETMHEYKARLEQAKHDREATLATADSQEQDSSPAEGSPAICANLTREWKPLDDLKTDPDLEDSTYARDALILVEAEVAERESVVEGLGRMRAEEDKYRFSDELKEDREGLVKEYLKYLFLESRGNVTTYTRGHGRETLASELKENFVQTRQVINSTTEIDPIYSDDAERTFEAMEDLPEGAYYHVLANTDRLDEAYIKALEDQAQFITDNNKKRITIKVEREALGEDEPTHSFICYKERDGEVLGETSIDLYAHPSALDRTNAILNLGLLASPIPKDPDKLREFKRQNPQGYEKLRRHLNEQYRSLDLRVGSTLIKEHATIEDITKILERIVIVLPPIELPGDIRDRMEQLNRQQDFLKQFA